MRTITADELQDAEERAKRAKTTFGMLSREAREAARPGDIAKLIFPGERMWVLITHVLGRGRYRGTLDNEPMNDEFSFGQPVEFEARHICALDTTEASPEGPSKGWKAFEARAARIQ